MVEAGRNGWQGGMKEKREGGRERRSERRSEGGRETKEKWQVSRLTFQTSGTGPSPFFLVLVPPSNSGLPSRAWCIRRG